MKNVFTDMEARLTASTYVVGDNFSVADITLLVTVDFAAKAIDLSLPQEHVALRRWHASVSARPSASA
ncbi:hypothetical protein BH11PSE13_BH11PSE13_21230 [soil metagenome]